MIPVLFMKYKNILQKITREELPDVSKIHYVSDGCTGQYKNYKHFLNLCLHKDDFGIEAEWIFLQLVVEYLLVMA